MTPTRKVIFSAVCFALVAGAISWHLADKPAQDGFWAGLFLNIVPEAVGIAAGIIGTLYLAARKASARFSELAEKIFDLIAQLRRDKSITEEAAQKIMVVIVPLLDDKLTPPTCRDGYVAGTKLPCRICAKESHFREGGTSKKCTTCGLRAEYWRSQSTPTDAR